MTLAWLARFRVAFLNRIPFSACTFEERNLSKVWRKSVVANFGTHSKLDDKPEVDEEVVSTVSSMLGVREGQAKLIVKKFPDFNTAKPQDLSKTLKYLVDKKGVRLGRILSNPWLLLIDPDTLEKRLKAVYATISPQSVQIALPFVKFSVSKLLEMGHLRKFEVKQEPSLISGQFPSRIEYLAKNLNCSEMEVADLMVRVNRLPVLPFRTIESILHLLLEGGVNVSDIVEDPWIFVHNISVMKVRIDYCHQKRLRPIKPWMLRCSLTKFDSYVERTLLTESIKPKDEKIDSFLQRRLNWSPACVQSVLSRTPKILKFKTSTLENRISFLLAKGFSSDDIANCPRILRQSVGSVATKLSELTELANEVGTDPVRSLSVLCRTQKEYEQFLNTWKTNCVEQIPR